MRFAKAKQVSSRAASDAPVYFDWRPPAASISIRLSYDVIDRLYTDIMKGFWAVPKRGAEIGGVLIGSVGSSPDGETVVTVDDYERVTCEYRRGPSYVLSEPDRKRLARALRPGKEQRVVGYFRSHTRPGLYLDENDMAVVGSFFSGANDVVLLVRPHATVPAVAGFFMWEQGDMRRHTTYQEFPFDTAALAEAAGVAEAPAEERDTAALGESERADEVDARRKAPLVESQPSLAEAPSSEESEDPVAQSEYARPRRNSPRAPEPAGGESRGPSLFALNSERPVYVRPRMRIPRPRPMVAAYAAMILAALGLMEYQIISGRADKRAETPTHVASLRVDRNGSSLTLHWDPAAPAVNSAERGVLLISDGDVEKQIPLDRAQLAAGMVAYSPLGNDVTFRLELNQHDRKVSEAVRVITGQAPPPRDASVSEAAGRPEKAADVASRPRRRSRTFFDDGL